MPESRVYVASNRGPVSFRTADDGTLSVHRGAGGLVTALRTAMASGRASWICTAISDGDRQAAAAAPGGRLQLDGAQVRMLLLDPLTYARAYNGIANGTLWFTSHHLYDAATQPIFDQRWRRDWSAYVDYNAAFADALAEEAEPGGRVLVQDYHLFLVPRLLRSLRPDLKIAHFTHTPWATPDYYRMLPDDVAAELLLGVLGADHAAFHTERWAQAFRDCCAAVLPGVETRTRIGVLGLGIDGDELRERAAAPDVVARLAALRAWAGDRKVVLRIDRTELSKNIVRGLFAFRELLRTWPAWHDRIVHLAFAYPSRHDLPEYREYTAAVQRTAAEINSEFGHAGWQPVRLEVSDDYARSLAALSLADVLVVNPVRDGMNLVAKEGPVLSSAGCALVLSREAGAAADLGAHALLVNPFDVSATAAAIEAGLRMPPDERARRTASLAAAATALPPHAWLDGQLAGLRQ